MSGSPNRYLNLLHREDAVSAILSVLKAPRGAEIYNACDGQHATRGQIAQWVAERLGVREPKFLDPTNDQGPNRRVNNFKLKNELGWMPKYPDFQSGYEDFLASGSG